jgi:SdpC family antimicrobial peptide
MIRKKAFLAILLAPLFLLAACDTSAPADTMTDEQVDIAKTANGEQLFKGIAFGHGPVAATLPEIYGNSGTQEAIELALEDDVAARAGEHMNMTREEVRDALLQAKEVDPAKLQQLSAAFMEQITEQITATEPGYFDQFEAKIRSGSHQDVQMALASMPGMIYPAIADITGLDVDDLRGQEVSTEKFLVVFVVVAVAVTLTAAVNVNAAANVNVAVNINEVANVDPLDEIQASSKLKNERIVDLLVQRFAI